jgi:protocatechuate 3,4-dioxygenase, alpha subunit
MSLGLTPSQTVGPFFSHALTWLDGPDVVAESEPGAIWLGGRVFDGNGEPVPDALIESWQASADGRFDHPDDPRGAVRGFRGYGRSATDAQGRWGIRTVLPGRVPGPDGRLQAPHVDLSVFARGLLDRLVTRIYFAGQSANAEDPVLSALPSDRRETLVAAAVDGGFVFDIRLQGERETVFFSV